MALLDRLQHIFKVGGPEKPSTQPGTSLPAAPTGLAPSASPAADASAVPSPPETATPASTRSYPGDASASERAAAAVGLAPDLAPQYAVLYARYHAARRSTLIATASGALPARDPPTEEAYLRLRDFCGSNGGDPALVDRIVADIDKEFALVKDLSNAQVNFFVAQAGSTDAQAISSYEEGVAQSRSRLEAFCIASGRDLDSLLKHVQDDVEAVMACFGT